MTTQNNYLTNKTQPDTLPKAKVTANISKGKTVKMRKRIPLGEQHRLASVDRPVGYVDRWINDVDGRVFKARKAGYEFIDREGSIIKEKDERFQDPEWQNSAMSQPVGGGITAYLMRVKKEFYDEDQAEKQTKIDAQENQMRKKNIPGVKTDQVYGEISISRGDKASEEIERRNLKEELTDEIIQELKNKGVI